MTYELVFALLGSMGTRNSQRRDHAQVATRIGDELQFFSRSTCQARHRGDWPQLSEALDDLVALVEIDGARPDPSPAPFDADTSRRS